MNWLLVVVLAILIVNALIGLKVGFIKMIFSLASMIIAIVLTVWISPTVNDYLKSNEKFYNYVSEKVDKVLLQEEKEVDTSEQEAYIEGLPLPKSIKESLIENKNKGINDIKEYIANYITGIIINALAFVITFVVILIILWIISFALNIISKLPIINQINKLAGILAGGLHGLIIVWVLFILLTVFGGSKFGQEAFALIEDSIILSAIYNNNFLLGFVTSATKLFL